MATNKKQDKPDYSADIKEMRDFLRIILDKNDEIIERQNLFERELCMVKQGFSVSPQKLEAPKKAKHVTYTKDSDMICKSVSPTILVNPFIGTLHDLEGFSSGEETSIYGEMVEEYNRNKQNGCAVQHAGYSANYLQCFLGQLLRLYKSKIFWQNHPDGMVTIINDFESEKDEMPIDRYDFKRKTCTFSIYQGTPKRIDYVIKHMKPSKIPLKILIEELGNNQYAAHLEASRKDDSYINLQAVMSYYSASSPNPDSLAKRQKNQILIADLIVSTALYKIKDVKEVQEIGEVFVEYDPENRIAYWIKSEELYRQQYKVELRDNKFFKKHGIGTSELEKMKNINS